jgi:hypothetical protein
MHIFTSANVVAALFALATYAAPAPIEAEIADIDVAKWEFKGFFPGTGCNHKASVQYGGTKAAGCARSKILLEKCFRRVLTI